LFIISVVIIKPPDDSRVHLKNSLRYLTHPSRKLYTGSESPKLRHVENGVKI